MSRGWLLEGSLLVALGVAATACGSSDDWQAGIDVGAMDRTADACEDFYQYACGGYIRDNPLPDDGAIIARRSKALFAAEAVQRAIFMAPDLDDADEAALASYNTACLQAGPGKQSRATLDDVLAQIDAASTTPDVARALAALHLRGGDAFFQIGSTRDLSDPGKRIAAVGDTGLGMPDRGYYLDPEQPELALYREHIQTLAALVGIDGVGLADAVIAIETALAKAMLPADEARDPLKTFHVQDRAAFEATMPSFDWVSYRLSVSAPSYATLDVTVPAYFAAIEQVLKTKSLAEVKHYLRWRAVEAAAVAMGDAVHEEEIGFHRGVFYGAPEPLARGVFCLRATHGALPWSMSKAYMARAFSPLAAGAASQMAGDVRTALGATLGRATWLDEPTRAAAQAKLDAMLVEVGGPSTWPSLSGLHIDSGSFVDAQTALASYRLRRSLDSIGKEDNDPWFLAPSIVNAAYSPTRNTVNVPAAILQPPFFDPASARVVQLGAIGSILGHEMTHGFDDYGRLFDASGKLGNLWTPKAEASFRERSQCLVDQYAAILGAPGLHIDGELTLGENIADLGGVKVAYQAASALLDEPGGELTGAQAFFVAQAQLWCSSIRPEYAATLLLTDPHAPDKARVNAVLANVPAFAEAFECAPGSPMAPEVRCDVW